jgi:tRNA threonylcarbamoyladenosine biosynthesis protein TsaE
MEILIENENKLKDAAVSLLKFAENEKIFLFQGEMGAGKTTLIKSLCLQLGMLENVSSPTYSLVNEYIFPEGKIFHFDYCFIEWPEMIPNLWPDNFLEIKITETEGGMRKIFAQKHSKS